MTREEFIKKIAPIVCKYAPKYNVLCPSAVISQAVLESDGGISELAVNAHNYFGLKYRAGRCPTASGIYYKIGSEQDPITGAYVSSAMKWMKFSSMEAGVQGYFDFTNISAYKAIKNISDPETYLKNIKAAGYATSIKYVENLMNVIKKYNLTQYDNVVVNNKNEEKKEDNKGVGKMIINVHAGHNPDGKVACGAVGLIKESTEARKVKDKVIEMLKAQGHTVYDCTVNDGTSASNVLSKIVAKCNAHTVDWDVSIHFNAGANKILNKATTGTEVLVYSTTSKAKTAAQNIVNSIAALGFKNRGVKYSKTLYFLRKTKNPALLIECCFVDDPDDVALYNADKMAKAIVKGITGVAPTITNTSATVKPVVVPTTTTTTTPSAPAYSHKNFVKEVQAAIGAKVDGIAGSETLFKTVTVSTAKNKKHAVVKPIQKYLNSIGYNCGTADGVAGAKFNSAIKAFQKANGCVADGEVTARGKTWRKLLKLS